MSNQGIMGIKRFDTGGQTGGAAVTSATTTTKGLPDYSADYITQLMKNVSDLTTSPAQTYGGQLTAGYNPMLNQGLGGLWNMTPSGYNAQAAGLAGMGATNQFTGANVGQYMSPYMNNVIAQQQAGAVRDYARQLPGMSAAASQVGGLGGTRQALVQAEGQRNLQNTLAGIQATGLQNAFQNAQNQFNQQQQNLFTGAGLLGNMGAQDYSQRAGIANAQINAGNVMRGIDQSALDAQYQKWLNEQNLPFNRLAFASNIYNQYNQPTQTSLTYGQAPNPLSLATSTIGGMNLFNTPATASTSPTKTGP